MSIRLNKFLAERIGVSRRESDDLIAAGKVLINDKKAEIGARIDKNDKVCYNNSIVPFDAEFLYVAFNKPIGYVCSRRAQGEAKTLYELLPSKYHSLKTVGRLDKDTSGLIILTNDGDFAFQMTHPKFYKEKTYFVELDRPLEPLHQQMISDYGVMLDDGPSKFTVIRGGGRNGSFEGPKTWASAPERPEKEPFDQDPLYTVILSEGRNRQIRRTFAALGYQVKKLHREQFGPYVLDGLKPGEFVEFKK